MCRILVLILICFVIGGNCRSPQRIFGGSLSQLGQFPYMIYWKVNGHFKCGGALVGSKYIVTAAHCMQNLPRYPSNVEVYTGSNTLLPSANQYKVKKIIPHPEYSSRNMQYDIGLLVLEKPVVFSKNVMLVKLPTRPHFEGEFVNIAGFGAVSLPYTNNRPRYLYHYRSPLMNHEQCKRLLTSAVITPVKMGQVCTFIGPGVGTCYGDSGSPVVADDGEFVGVVSYGKPCAKGVPDVHSDVYYNLKFILDVMHSN